MTQTRRYHILGVGNDVKYLSLVFPVPVIQSVVTRQNELWQDWTNIVIHCNHK